MSLNDSLKQVLLDVPCHLIIFGATGDLTLRKLLPALYSLEKSGALSKEFTCIAFARREKTLDSYLKEVKKFLAKQLNEQLDEKVWKRFASKIFYHKANFVDPEGFESLLKNLEKKEKSGKKKWNRIFYLATHSKYFIDIIAQLSKHQLIHNSPESIQQHRVVIEKPFGYDLASAKKMQSNILKYLDERQIFRIDHYLGKETVQNLLVFRFSNPVFESMWNRHYIDHIQITVAEDIGIGSRGRFFEENGILRDIAQNHIMQLLCLTTMEPPSQLDALAIQNEKIKLIKSIRPFKTATLKDQIVRAQYTSGKVSGKMVKAYQQEDDVAPNSLVETYFAMQLYIDNWRFSGVPIFLRTGKRLSSRRSEIAIAFKEGPQVLFNKGLNKNLQNTLVLRIQPDEGISFYTNCKSPKLSATPTLNQVEMSFDYLDHFENSSPDAYQRLICDAILNDKTLFTRDDEVMLSWELFEPVLKSWKRSSKPIARYAAGTEGPKESDLLIRKFSRNWRPL